MAPHSSDHPPPDTISYRGLFFYPVPLALPSDTPGAAYSRPGLNNPTLRGLSLGILSNLIVRFLRPVGGLLYSNAGFPALHELNVETDYAGVPGLKGPLRGFSPRWDPTVIPRPVENGSNFISGGSEYKGSVSRNWSGRFLEKYALKREDGGLSPVDIALVLLEMVERKQSAQKVVPIGAGSGGSRSGKRGLHTAWMHVDREGVLSAASQSAERWDVERRRTSGEDVSDKEGVRWIDLGDGRRGCLDGVFIGVKDEILVKSHPITYGTGRPHIADPDINSWAVQKLVDYGAIVLGTTVMHEFGLDTTNNNPTLGTPLNPFSEEFYSGGSSGGSASAVGCGVVPIALGADGGGSIRIPSAYCGVFGLKPSHGRVSGWPLVNDCVSTCVIGPLAATMHDLELAYKVMALPNPSDSSSAFLSPMPIASSTPNTPALTMSTSTRRKYLALPRAWFSDSTPDVQRLCKAAIDHLTTHVGYTLITPEDDPDINIPFIRYGQLAHALTILNEVTSAISGLDGWRSWLTPANKLLMGVSAHATAQDLLLAQKLRALLMSHLAHLFAKYPGLVIITPTLPDPLRTGHIHSAHDIKVGGYGVADNNRSLESMRYVFLANFTGVPAISAPVGYLPLVESQGKNTEETNELVIDGTYAPSSNEVGRVLPVGIMGMAEWAGEENLLGLGYELERYLINIVRKEKSVSTDVTVLEGEARPQIAPSPAAWVDVLGKAAEFARVST